MANTQTASGFDIEPNEHPLRMGCLWADIAGDKYGQIVQSLTIHSRAVQCPLWPNGDIRLKTKRLPKEPLLLILLLPVNVRDYQRVQVSR